MKTLIAFIPITAAIFILSACGEPRISASEVPQPVMAAFNSRYAGVGDAEWHTEKQDGKLIYEARFKKEDKKVEAEFDAAGTFIKED